MSSAVRLMIWRTSCAEMSFSASGAVSSTFVSISSRARENTSPATPAACGTADDVPLESP